jgi:putative oxidoreductase
MRHALAIGASASFRKNATMQTIIARYDRLTAWLTGLIPASVALLFVRLALAGVFWFSGRTKVEEGTLLTIKETTLFQFADAPFNNVPLPPDLAAHMSLYAEFLVPILLVLGLFTRFSALALLGMTLVIQFFVFPEAWWQVHILWVAMALTLITRGAGILSLDHLLSRKRAQPALARA